LLTTGSFTVDATREAIRNGANPIKLVDGEKLVRMFEKIELGFKPKVVYEVDMNLFNDFDVGSF
jgi:restriction system protein